jgi:hypothetical protein
MPMGWSVDDIPRLLTLSGQVPVPSSGRFDMTNDSLDEM